MKRKNKKDYVGEENYNTLGTLMKIVEYRNCQDITIEFQDKHKYQKICQYDQFKKGNVQNPYDKTVCGVGYLGDGDYKTRDGEKHSLPYIKWLSMLQRCYDPYKINKHMTYIDCYVCEDWLNFQNFAKWFDENYYKVKNEKMDLDKDILIKGNRIYSPDTCIFVPTRINMLFTKTNKARGEYPIGVTKRNNKYQAICSILDRESNKKKNIILGKFDNLTEAFLSYKTFKESYIKQVADEYKDLIPNKLYEAMYSYSVEIND